MRCYGHTTVFATRSATLLLQHFFASYHGLHPRLPFELAEIITEPATMLFAATIQNGSIPEDWEKATILYTYLQERLETVSKKVHIIVQQV